jgi:hypothetical protein
MSDWFADGSHSAVCDVHGIMDSVVPSLLWGLVAAGNLVSIGTTRDRGALSVTITNDGRWRREYFRDSEDLAEWLREATIALVAQQAPNSATDPGRQARLRSVRKTS